MKMIGVCADFLRCRISAGRLEAVHVRHVDVEQDDGELLLEHLLQRLLAGAGGDDVLPQLLEDRAEDDMLVRQVVDDQDVGLLRARRGARRLGHQDALLTACSQARSTASICSRVDRLGQVVPGAGLDALLAVALHGLGRHRDDRQVLARAAACGSRAWSSMPSISGIMMSISTMSMSGVVWQQADGVAAVVGRDDVHVVLLQHAWSGRRCCACRRRRSAPSCRPAAWSDSYTSSSIAALGLRAGARTAAVQREQRAGRAAARASAPRRTVTASSRVPAALARPCRSPAVHDQRQRVRAGLRRRQRLAVARLDRRRSRRPATTAVEPIVLQRLQQLAPPSATVASICTSSSCASSSSTLPRGSRPADDQQPLRGRDRRSRCSWSSSSSSTSLGSGSAWRRTPCAPDRKRAVLARRRSR